MKKLALLFILCMVSMLAFAQADSPADSVGGLPNSVVGIRPNDSVGVIGAGLTQQGLLQDHNNQPPSDSVGGLPDNNGTLEHPNWVQVPGELIRPDCVHEIPNGANVEIANGQITGDVTLNGVVIAHYDACPEDAISTRHQGRTQNLDEPPSGNGWVEQAQWDDVNHNIDLLEGSWIVPTKPSRDGGVLYLFNGIEPSSQKYILQPALQYGYNGYFGGNYWTIASWLVGNTGVFYSSPETVRPGDGLTGYTELTRASGGILYYEVVLEDTTTGAYTLLEVQSSGLRWSWAYGAVLEAYYITSCSQFPPDHEDAFSDIFVYQGPPGYMLVHPEWDGFIDGYGGPSCGFAVDIKLDNKITLHY